MNNAFSGRLVAFLGFLLNIAMVVANQGQSRAQSDPGKQSDPPLHTESFDKIPVKEMPKGWSRWTGKSPARFECSTAKPFTGTGGLTTSGGSGSAGRIWLDSRMPADIQARVMVLLNTLVPIEVILRGKGLDTALPAYYAVQIVRGLQVQLVRVTDGKATALASIKSARYLSEKWITITISARGSLLRAQVFRPDTKEFMDDAGGWTPDPVWALRAKDEQIADGGHVGLGRVASYAGAVFLDDFSVSHAAADNPLSSNTGPANADAAGKQESAPLPLPPIPRHYNHIRIAALAYNGNPMQAFEDKLLRESIDLVIPNPVYLKHIDNVAPKTPQLIYTNTSNLYLTLLLDWLSFARKNNLPAEGAFYHVRQPKAFTGDSPSSKPVNWFWGVYRGHTTLADLTAKTQSKSPTPAAVGDAGESLYLGFPERFCEINIQLQSGAGGGWSAVLEYATRTDERGIPSAWTGLAPKSDTTEKLTRSGRISFDPPVDWLPGALNSSAELFYVRFRVVSGGKGLVATSIQGRDYVEANGKPAGTIPAFDFSADKNNDGYLDDSEYARRDPARNARFVYESRVFAGYYGQMRFATNPSNGAYRKWAVAYQQRYLSGFPLADGLFMDNSEGKPPVDAAAVLEPLHRYADDYGEMINAIARALAPRWIIVNTAGGAAKADPVVKRNPIYLEEFAIRPLAHHYVYFEDLAALVARRGRLTSQPPYAILDSHPQRGSPVDDRMLIATLACYYLLADPDCTFLMFYGGFEPASPWKRHWTPAAAFDVGRPTDKWSQLATGPDPSNGELSYRLYRRPYEKALVLYKPLSYARGSKAVSSLGDETATSHDLGNSYQPLLPDGTLGKALRKITLRNGEGAILVKGTK